MSHTHSDSENQTDLTHDDSLSDVNIKVRRLYLSEDDHKKGILITAETEKSTTEKRILLELEHPDHFGLILLNYKGLESDDYFPLNSTVKVKELVLKKSIDRRHDLNYLLKNIFCDDVKYIITKNGYDCRYLCEEAILYRYTVVLCMKLEIIDTNNSFRRFAFYLDDGSSIFLCRAIRNKDMEMIKVLLNFKFDINAKNETSETPLHVAVDLEMSDVVDLLISNGADVNATNGVNQVPLHIATEKNNLKILDSLLKNQAKLDKRDEDGKTPLHYAVFNRNENVVDLLISNGANVNIRNKYFEVPLHYAAKNNNLNILDNLLRNQANLKTRDKVGRTPLHYAVDAGNVDVVDILLKRGADYKLKDECCKTPFDYAVIHLNLDMIKVFLDNNADSNIVNPYKQTPLHAIGRIISTKTSLGIEAADKDTYLKIINALVQKGANINFQDSDGNTPLHYAVMNENSAFIQALLECNADPAIKNCDGDNVLHLASTKVRADNFIQVILDSNVDIDAVNRNGDTALHLAIKRNDGNVVELILKKNPNIDMKNVIGYTALHEAVTSERCRMVDLLLQNGANVDLKDASRRTALHLAATLPEISTEIIEAILNYTNDIDAKDEHGSTALHYAALNTDDRTLEMLLKAKADVNVKDSAGNTPLHLTMFWDDRCPPRFESMQVLVNYQADVNAVDNDMRTPLHHACWNGNVEAVEYLIENGADCSMRDRDGRTVFHHACMINRGLYQEERKALRDLLNILVEEDVSVNCVDKFGKTPLHYIVEENYCWPFHFHEQLLKIGANINIEDKDHKTVIDTLLKKCYTYQYEKLKPYIEHVIKMRKMGMWVHERTLEEFYEVNDQSDLQKMQLYQRDCRKEIDLMNINIDQCDITYYNFLKKSPHKAMNYTRNENVVNAIKSDELLEVFPIYGHFLKCHLRDIQRRSNLYEKIRRFLKSSIFEMLLTDCMHEIFQYLNNSDLDNFLQALKPVVLIK